MLHTSNLQIHSTLLHRLCALGMLRIAAHVTLLRRICTLGMLRIAAPTLYTSPKSKPVDVRAAGSKRSSGEMPWPFRARRMRVRAELHKRDDVETMGERTMHSSREMLWPFRVRRTRVHAKLHEQDDNEKWVRGNQLPGTDYNGTMEESARVAALLFRTDR
jgi:hypothetical protein